MQITPIKTRKFLPPQDDIYQLLNESIVSLEENTILLIASKIIAIHQGRCLAKNKIPDKNELAISESDYYLPLSATPSRKTVLTIRDHSLVSSAGIDESNADNYYILRPTNSNQEAEKIQKYLKEKFTIKNLGIIIVDSQSIPLRAGSVGISLGFFGFEPLSDLRGKSDIFDKKLKHSRINIVDSIAAISSSVMGEANEQTPLAIVKNLPKLKFTDKNTNHELYPKLEHDYFYDLLKDFKKYQL